MSDTIQESLRMWVRGEWVAMTDQELVTEAADEIDRLSQTVRGLEQRLAERDKELVQAKADLEHSLWFNRESIWVSRDQINDAWEFSKCFLGPARNNLKKLLSLLGIIPCPKCGGSSRLEIGGGINGEEVIQSCLTCYRSGRSHGWVMEER